MLRCDFVSTGHLISTFSFLQCGPTKHLVLTSLSLTRDVSKPLVVQCPTWCVGDFVEETCCSYCLVDLAKLLVHLSLFHIPCLYSLFHFASLSLFFSSLSCIQIWCVLFSLQVWFSFCFRFCFMILTAIHILASHV